ncbi:MAG: malto-oligosyltrehalose synthase [Erysipelotrichia bacterium]|nr:malto-oligosyltrehalose synthase [Erysipelotrichia bacterium]
MKFYPGATYRLQLNPEFGFAAASEFVEYFHALGISHIYLSPCLQPVKKSSHGYDVIDHSHINTELGGMEGFEAFVAELKKVEMGIILDIVPNHMAIGGPENPWWWDVLENGPSSNYARFFDVDWHFESDHHTNLILLPVLGDHYGIVLEAGEFELRHDYGRFTLHYHENIFPVAPRSVAVILGIAQQQSGIEELGYLADSFHALPLAASRDIEKIERRARDQKVLNKLLRNFCHSIQNFKEAINAAINVINSDYDLLDNLIGRQNYKLAYWKLSTYQVGYRRFFNINSLVGLRMEDEQVFNDSHRLVLDLEKAGKIDGFRVDHPDGLYDPTGYFTKLRKACPGALIYAEKILERNEVLNPDWPISGTTGYDFLNLVNGLFVNPEGLRRLQEYWEQIIEDRVVFDELVHQRKIRVIKDLLGSEISRLASDLAQICENHRRYRDFAYAQLYQTIAEVAAAFSVYRTYIQPEIGQISEVDKKHILAAVHLAKSRRPEHGEYIFDFVADILLLKFKGERENQFVRRFQQFTGPVMAKSVEDTVFYIYNPLVSLNEVGGHPFESHVSVIDFHQWCEYTAKNQPLTMLASSTHDTKRSEDVRARLNLLSEIPEAWINELKSWVEMNKKYRVGCCLDSNTEYLLYQTLVGAWPISQKRIEQYMQKAVREARVHSDWAKPDHKFEADLKNFIEKLYSDADFIVALENFVKPLVIAGRLNSLSQATLKLTAPGLPDIYQGNEIWDNSLVDPDNRRPLDLTANYALLKKLENMDCGEILRCHEEGLPKLFLIKTILEMRRNYPVFNEPDSYIPVEILGSYSENIVAYMRGEEVLVIVPLLRLELKNRWDNTRIILSDGKWQDIFSGNCFAGGSNKIKDLLRDFPVAVLIKSRLKKGE